MNLKIIYKKILSIFFLFFYGKVVSKKKKIKNLQIVKLNKINNENVSKYNYKLYRIKEGRVFTNYVENVSVISDNQLIEGASFQQIDGLLKNKQNETLFTGTPKFIKEIKGNMIILAQGASGYDNYAHWLLDILPKLKLVLSKISIKKIGSVYFQKLNNFQKDSLSYLGLSSNKFLDSNHLRHVKADQIISTSHPYYFKKTFKYAQSNLPSWIIRFLRKDISRKINFKKKGYKKVFIDRSDSRKNHCKLINNDDVIKFLKKEKFKCLQLSKLSLKEQIAIFKNCRTIVAPHGAGLTNIAFCKKKTRVIEIIPSNNKNYLFKRISKINKLEYKSIYLDKIYDNKNGDMHLNLIDLKKNL